MSNTKDKNQGQSSNALTWQAIAARDPFLAGSIAAREWEWWQLEEGEGDAATPEREAATVGLVGASLATFVQGWYFELAEREAERKADMWAEYERAGAGYTKGDPAARTSWKD